MKKRLIYFLTGARSEYEYLRPVLNEVQKSSILRGELIVSAGHLSPFHGSNLKLLRRDRIPIAATIESLLAAESLSGRALSFAQLFEGLIRFLNIKRPDILIVAGDREEALAGALAANFLGIPVGHIHGGDRCLASNLDEVFRPTISKLSHLHFTATEQHRKRLIRLGEDPKKIWNVGATSLDGIRAARYTSDAVLWKRFGLRPKQPFFIVIYHSCPSVLNVDAAKEIREILKGVLSLGHRVFCSYPNYDPGNIAIREVIDAFKTQYSNLQVHHNLLREDFYALYRNCSAIVGNSSSIVIESGFFKVPGILIGQRQDLREIGPNVIRIKVNAENVKQACRRSLEDRRWLNVTRKSVGPYGKGFAGPKISRILRDIELSNDLLLKTMLY